MTETEKLAAGIRNRGSEIAKKSGLIKFDRIKEANAEIQRLETVLGISPSRPTFNIFAANRRIVELQSLVSRKSGAPTSELHGLARAAAAVKIHGPTQIPFSGGAKTGRDRFKNAVRLEGQRKG